MEKRRVLVDYTKLPANVLNAVSQKYPKGFKKDVIRIMNHKKEYITALPFDVDNTVYLIKVATPTINQSEDDFLDYLEEQSKQH